MKEIKMSFADFMKKYAPSLNIDTNNPSTLQMIATMKCDTLLNSNDEVVYGLNDTQRREACKVITNFQTIIRATVEADSGSSEFTEQSKKQLDPALTVEQLYDLTKASIEKATSKETPKK